MTETKKPTDLLGIAPYGEALREVASRTLDAAGAFLSRICLPAAEEYGLMWRDRVSARRARLAAERLSEAAAAVAATGVEPREVPMRTLVPLLDGASIEEDPDLAKRWTALMANAAHPDSAPVPPIYPAILGQLSPLDAKILVAVRDLISAGFEPDEKTGRLRRWGARRGEVQVCVGDVDDDDVDVALTTTISLGLLADEPVVRNDGESIFFTDGEEFRLSSLGDRFLRACEIPKSSSSK